VYTLTLREANELILSFVPEPGGGDTWFPIEEWVELAVETAEQKIRRRLRQIDVAIALLHYELDADSRPDVARLSRGLLESIIETVAQTVEQCELAAAELPDAPQNRDVWGQLWRETKRDQVGQVKVVHYERSPGGPNSKETIGQTQTQVPVPG
jgi:hypothetical protein